MPKWLTFLITILVVISLTLMIFSFTHLKQDTTTFPYGNIVVYDDIDRFSNVIIVSDNSLNNDTFTFQGVFNIYHFGSNYLNLVIEFDYFFPGIDHEDMDTVIEYNYKGLANTYFTYSSLHSLNAPLYELNNDLTNSSYLPKIAENYYVDIDFGVIFNSQNNTLEPVTTNNTSFGAPMRLNYSEFDFNFLSFREQFKSITAFQYATQPTLPSGNAWEFVLSLIIDDFYGGFLWLVQWVAVPISLLGGLYLW